MKPLVSLVLCCFLPIWAFAQTGEVYLRLNSLNGANTFFKEKSVNRTSNALYDLDYGVGYNHFFNEDVYVGVDFGYVRVATTTNTSNPNINGLNEAMQKVQDTRYSFGVQLGKLSEVNKLRLYSQVGFYTKLFRDTKSINNNRTYDTAGVLLLDRNSVESFPQANQYTLYLSQGFYYPIFKGLSVGLSVRGEVYYATYKGAHETILKTTALGMTTEQIESFEEDNTSYSFGLVPAFGIRFTF